MYTEDTDRIRKRAYEIWMEEGCPEGRADAHWDKAREEIAAVDNYRDTLRPNPVTPDDDRTVHTEPVEPLVAVESLGDVPDISDLGEERQYPAPRRRDAG